MPIDWDQFSSDLAQNWAQYWKDYERNLRGAIAEAFANELQLSDDLLDKLAAKGVALAKDLQAKSIATHH